MSSTVKRVRVVALSTRPSIAVEVAKAEQPPPHREHFPADHPCEALREYPFPGVQRMRKSIADRCVWLDRRIGENTRAGGGVAHHVLELASLVRMEAEWTAMRTAREEAFIELGHALNASVAAGRMSEADAVRLFRIARRDLKPAP